MNRYFSLILIIVCITCSKSDNENPNYSSTSNSSLSNNSNPSSSDPVALSELPSGTFVFSVSAQNSTNYRISVTDSNNTQFGFDPTLKVNAGDDIVFNVNSPGHPFFLKTMTGVGSNNQIPDVTNNGSENGTISWTVPAGSSGTTFYYLCSIHNSMLGSIIVL
jgi:plastocyanin|tara:strand:+ start:41 stop:529 length:489 start_codon:yes stop_codon:yes gene_type:complete